MSQALEDQLVQLVTNMNSAVFFAQKQLPEVLDQLLTYKLTEALIWFVISTLIFFPYAIKVYHDATHKNPNPVSFSTDLYNWVYSKDNDGHPLIIVHFMVLMIASCTMVATATEALQIILAPKLYILEYMRHLV